MEGSLQGALEALKARAGSLDEASVPELVASIRLLLRVNEELYAENVRLGEENEELRAAIARLTKVPRRPKIRPGSGKDALEGGGRSGGSRKKKKPRGRKRHRKHAKRVRVPLEDPPPGAVHLDYQSYYVQSLNVEVRHTLYERQRMRLPDGTTITAPLPEGVVGSYNVGLHRFVLGLYHQAQSTIPRIVHLLDALGLDISSRQVRRILTGNRTGFTDEAARILSEGLRGAKWISVDDTGARHMGDNHHCTSIGNDRFAWFGTTASKSRLSFLDIMCGTIDDHLLDPRALRYMETHRIPSGLLTLLTPHAGRRIEGSKPWSKFLDGIGIHGRRSRRIATEGARLSSLFAHGLLHDDTAILSDGAPQFDIGLAHYLCWVHEERLYRKLPVWSTTSRAAVEKVRRGIWRTYRLLRAYCRRPTRARRAVIERRFERTFRPNTNIRMIDDQISRSLNNRNKLLRVLDRPDVPLHNNQRENDLRASVCRRKISSGTRSDAGRDCRDAFLTLMKTCQRHNISFWDYLGDRLGVPGAHPVPHLPALAPQTSPAPAPLPAH